MTDEILTYEVADGVATLTQTVWAAYEIAESQVYLGTEIIARDQKEIAKRSVLPVPDVLVFQGGSPQGGKF